MPVAVRSATDVGTKGGSGSLRLLPRLTPVETTLHRHLPVATCIGCGARSHSAECPDGCTDLPLDLVDVDDLAAVATRAEALEERVAALRAVVGTLADDAPVDWTGLQEQARTAVLLPVPLEPEVTIIEGWGCPRCGRVDAPQPCLGICLRRPGLVADAAEYREHGGRAEEAAAADRALSQLVHVVVGVRPRPGRATSRQTATSCPTIGRTGRSPVFSTSTRASGATSCARRSPAPISPRTTAQVIRGWQTVRCARARATSTGELVQAAIERGYGTRPSARASVTSRPG